MKRLITSIYQNFIALMKHISNAFLSIQQFPIPYIYTKKNAKEEKKEIGLGMTQLQQLIDKGSNQFGTGI